MLLLSPLLSYKCTLLPLPYRVRCFENKNCVGQVSGGKGTRGKRINGLRLRVVQRKEATPNRSKNYLFALT